MNVRRTISFSVLLFSAAFFIYFIPVKANVSDEIAEKQKQIEELQKQIDSYQQQIDTTQTKSRTLGNEISRLNAQINQVTLEIKSLELSINRTSLEINDTETQIGNAVDKITKHKTALAQYIKLAYENDQKTLTEILLKNKTLSDFFNDLNSISTTQDNLRITINNIKGLKAELEQKQGQLEEKKDELMSLKQVQDIERKNLNGSKTQKNQILKETKGQESKFQDMLKKSQKDLQAIQGQITYLIQYGVSAENAVKYGQLAAIATGIRPAFLLGILEIESGLGKNVGTGNWMDDMYGCYKRLGKTSRAEAEKAAFMKIIGKLGLDPNTVRVSAEPNYGCGGALGPAQFLPSTWLAYEERTAALTGHNPPNPWSIEDAFMAAGIKLAAAGATSKTKAGETAAAKAYISGNSKCTSSICNYYANAVLRKAAEIEPNL